MTAREMGKRASLEYPIGSPDTSVHYDPVTAVTLVVGAIGTGVSYVGQKKAAKAQKRRADLEAKQQRFQAQRERIRTVREARIKRAAIAAEAGASGTLGGSAFAGGTGSIQSQAAGNIGYIGQQEGLSQGITRANKDYISGQSLANLGSTIFNARGLAGKAAGSIFS